MKLLADEGVDRQIVAFLRDEGHEVLYIAELDPGPGIAKPSREVPEGRTGIERRRHEMPDPRM